MLFMKSQKALNKWFSKSLTRELTLSALGVTFSSCCWRLSFPQAVNLLGRAAEGQMANEAVAAVLGFTTLGFFGIDDFDGFATILVVLTRIWRDHEMVVWLSSGLSLGDWVWPVMRFTLPLAALIAGVTLFIGPWADQRSQDYAEQIKRREEVSAISPVCSKNRPRPTRCTSSRTIPASTARPPISSCRKSPTAKWRRFSPSLVLLPPDGRRCGGAGHGQRTSANLAAPITGRGIPALHRRHRRKPADAGTVRQPPGHPHRSAVEPGLRRLPRRAGLAAVDADQLRDPGAAGDTDVLFQPRSGRHTISCWRCWFSSFIRTG